MCALGSWAKEGEALARACARVRVVCVLCVFMCVRDLGREGEKKGGSEERREGGSEEGRKGWEGGREGT